MPNLKAALGTCLVSLSMATLPCAAQSKPNQNDTAAALVSVEKAAQAGDPAAAVSLGNYYHGQGPEKYAEAFGWFKKAAEKGNAEGQFNLATMYQVGHGVEKDPVQAFEWFQRAAEKGHAGAQTCVGMSWFDGIGTSQNFQEAFKWLNQSAMTIPGHGRTELGILYASGWGVAKNREEAAKWFKMAEADGDAQAKDSLQILSLQIEADKGDAKAQFDLASRYYLKNGNEAVMKEARQWMLKSAEGGYAPAEAALAAMIDLGKGGPQDPAECAKWYLKAAQHGDVNAQARIGILYVSGGGVSMDLEEGKKWLLKAAGKDSDLAEFQLGLLFENGIGFPRNRTEALSWFRKSSDHGNKDAERALKQLSSQPENAPISSSPPVELSAPGELALKGISGSKNNRLALINNQTFSVGESANVQLSDRKQRLRCLEIRENSVLVQIEGTSEKKELFMEKKKP